MRLGIGSYTFVWEVGVPGYPVPVPSLTPRGLLDRAVQLGVGVVQVADNLPLDRLSPRELDNLAEDARQRAIDLEVGTRGIGREHLRVYLRLAERLASPILRVVIDEGADRPSPEEVLTRLEAVVPEFERAGVCLAIENHDRFQAATLAAILDRVGSSHVGICLDTANSLGCLETLPTLLEALGSRIVNLHIKDVCAVRQPHHKGFVIEGRPAGQGLIDIPWLLAELRRLGRDANAIIELWPPPEPTVADSVAKEQSWALESVRYLRQFISD